MPTDLAAPKVLIQSEQYCAGLVSPQKSEVPLADLIIKFLNATLAIGYKLNSAWATAEGGVEGVCHGEVIELRNTLDEIGLEDYLRFEKNPVCEKILSCYTALLTTLFEEEILHGGHKYSQGAIMHLSLGESEMRYAKQILWATIQKWCGGLVYEVFEHLKEPDPFIV